jgi:hypothetical protein
MVEKLGKKIDKLSNQLTDLRLDIYMEYVFTWKWWILVMICIIFPIIFFILVRKDRYLQAIAYFGTVYIINKNMDDIATALDWYDYRIQLEPIIGAMLPANLFAIPISLTLIYQYFSKWKFFILAVAIYAASVAFIALPIFKEIGMYLPKDWTLYYSFLSLVVISSLSKFIIDKVKAVQEKAR